MRPAVQWPAFTVLMTFLFVTTSHAAPVGNEFRVNTYTPTYQTDPSVSMAGNGSFVVVWGSYDQGGKSGDIFGQGFTSAGTARGTEFLINTYTPDTQNRPSVGTATDGRFVVVWRGPL